MYNIPGQTDEKAGAEDCPTGKKRKEISSLSATGVNPGEVV